MQKVGKHILVNVYDIQDVDKIKSADGMFELMNNIINDMKLNVLDYVVHNFQPFGTTMVYLLSESHMSVHTWPQHYSFCFDLFTCNPDTDLNEVCHIIYEYFGKQCKISKKIVDR